MQPIRAGKSQLGDLQLLMGNEDLIVGRAGTGKSPILLRTVAPGPSRRRIGTCRIASASATEFSSGTRVFGRRFIRPDYGIVTSVDIG
jgi:hypothetical protein